MLRSGNAHAGIAATTSTTKGGEDTTNSQSELDSLPDTDDESQGSESDTDSEAHRSDDQQSAEDDVSTSTTDAKVENHERHSRDLEEELLTAKFRRSFVRSSKMPQQQFAMKSFGYGRTTRNYEGYYVDPGRSSTSCINFVVAGKRQYSNFRRRSGTSTINAAH